MFFKTYLFFPFMTTPTPKFPDVLWTTFLFLASVKGPFFAFCPLSRHLPHILSGLCILREYIMLSQPEHEDQNPTEPVRRYCNYCCWGGRLLSYFCQPLVALRMAVWNTPWKRIPKLLSEDCWADSGRACERNVVISWERHLESKDQWLNVSWQ